MATGDCNTAQLRIRAKRGNRAALGVLMWDFLGYLMDGWPAKEAKLYRFLREGSTGGASGAQKRIITLGQAGAFVGAFITLCNFSMFVLLSALLPCVCLVAFILFEASWQTHALELVLSGLYVATLSAIVFLAPRVWHFHCFTSLLYPVEQHMLSILNDINGVHHMFHGEHFADVNVRLADIKRDCEAAKPLTLKLLQRAYSGWITGCHVQRGLPGKLGPWMPALVHCAGRQEPGVPIVRPKFDYSHMSGYARSIDWRNGHVVY